MICCKAEASERQPPNKSFQRTLALLANAELKRWVP